MLPPNQEKRSRKFDRELRLYKSNPMYETVKELYLANGYKSILSAEKALKKVKVTKSGTINKNSIKAVDRIEAKKEESSGLKKSISLTISEKNLDLVDSWVHYAQCKKMAKAKPNSLFIHKVTFYNGDGTMPQNDEWKPLSIEFFKSDFINGNIKHKINLYISLGSDLEWIVRQFIRETYNTSKGDKLVDPNRYVVLDTYAFAKVQKHDPKARLIQLFRANQVGTCVYDAFVEYFQARAETNRNAKACLNKLVDKRDIYAKPYNLAEIEELAISFKASVTIKDLIGFDDIVLNKSEFNRFHIELINTKYNHLDLYKCANSQITTVKESEYKMLKAIHPFYVEKFGKLYTIDGTYKQADSDFKTVFDQWKETNNLSQLSIKSDSDIYKIITEGYDFNMHTIFKTDVIPNNSLYKEVDLKKAYYSYSNKELNGFYHGVPSGSFITYKPSETFTINDFNEITSNGLIGFYEVRILKTTEKLSYYGFVKDSVHVLSSANVCLLSKYCQFKFLVCSYAPSVDIGFNDKFLQKEDGLAYYCKAWGLLMRDSNTTLMEIKPLHADNDFYKTQAQNRALYRVDDGLYKIVNQLNNFTSYKHIAIYIHSYVVTQILNLLLAYDIDDVIGVKLDSIILKADAVPIINEAFSMKEANIENIFKPKPKYDLDDGVDMGDNNLDGIFRPYKIGYVRERSMFSNVEPLFTNFQKLSLIIKRRIVYIGGAGGSGKTYSLLNSKNFYHGGTTVYSTCAWRLIATQKEAFPHIIGTSLPKLLGEYNGTKVEQMSKTSVRLVIIDEATLMEKSTINKVIKEFPNAFIFVLGDVDYDGKFYQCAINSVVNPSSIKKLQYISYTKSFRFDTKLNTKLSELRTMMKAKKSIGELISWTKNNFTYMDSQDINFADDDIGISALNSNIKKIEKLVTKADDEDVYSTKLVNRKIFDCPLSKYFISKGTSPQYVIKNSVPEKGQYRGDILFTKPSHRNYYESLFHTIHSFQGSQLTHTNKIIIYMDSTFDYNLIYTALSRARRCDQIIFISNKIKN